VIYSLTEIETETEIEIISLTETKRETEMFSKTETKYKRKLQRTKRNINWNDNDFKTKMITYVGKKQAFQCFDLILSFPSGSADNQSRRSSTCASRLTSTCMKFGPGQLCQKKMSSPSGADGRQILLAPLAQDLLAAPASQAYVGRVFSVCGWLTAGRRNRLSKILKCSCFWNWTRTWCDYDWSSKD